RGERTCSPLLAQQHPTAGEQLARAPGARALDQTNRLPFTLHCLGSELADLAADWKILQSQSRLHLPTMIRSSAPVVRVFCQSSRNGRLLRATYRVLDHRL